MAGRDETVRRGSYRDLALQFPERAAASTGSGQRCPTCGRYRRGRSAGARAAREQVALALEGIAAAYSDPESLRTALRDLAAQLRESVAGSRPHATRP